MSESHLTELSFSGLHLPELLEKGLADAGFERCTPIQAQTLPEALAGFDVAGQAQTGTGKTAAFLVALFAKLLRVPASASRRLNAPRALIVAPTRELAVQIHSDAELLGSHTGLRLGLAFGGVDYEKQRHHLEAGVDVLIGTPGRIIDFSKQGVIDLKSVQVVVLDEADRMFDLGFISDIRYILRRLPPPDQRLNMLFSATLSQRVLELAYEHMNDPHLVRIEPDKMTVDRVRQVIYYPSMEEKPRLLVGLFKQMDCTRSMVFVNTRRAAEELQTTLQLNGINAEAISGDVPQRKRLRLLQDFHAGTLAVLIGTDVASRGLHIPEVSHVFNYDLPQDPEDYVHRIGRTARAGQEGDAISFGCEEYVVSLPDIEAYIGRKLPVAAVPTDELPELVPEERRSRSYAPYRPGGGGRGGSRPQGNRSGGGRSSGGRPGGGGRSQGGRSQSGRPGGHSGGHSQSGRSHNSSSGGSSSGHNSTGSNFSQGQPATQSAPPPPAPSSASESSGAPAPADATGAPGGANKRRRRRRGGRKPGSGDGARTQDSPGGDHSSPDSTPNS